MRNEFNLWKYWFLSLVVTSLCCMQCGQAARKSIQVPAGGEAGVDGAAGPSQTPAETGPSTGAGGAKSAQGGGVVQGASAGSDAQSSFDSSFTDDNSAAYSTARVSGQGSGAGCIGADTFTCNAETALVKYSNKIRAKVGLQALRQNYQLSYVARDWSAKQGTWISHTGFPGARKSVFQQTFPNVSVPAISAENVALNSASNDPDAVGKAFADQWEGSPGHYENIVGDHSLIGVGISCTGSDSASGDSASGLNGLLQNFWGGAGQRQCTGTQIFAD